MAEILNRQTEIIVFDWDGFLAQSLKVWLDAFRAEYMSHNLNPSNSEISARFGHWEKAFGTDDANTIKAISDGARVVAVPKLLNVELYEGAIETIKLVRAKRDSGAIGGFVLWTGSHLDAIREPLSHHGLTEMFDQVITRSDDVAAKPDPAAFDYIARMLGIECDPGQIVVFGDTNNDLLAAKAFDARSVLFLPPENLEIYGPDQITSFQALEPTYTARSHADVQRIILGITS